MTQISFVGNITSPLELRFTQGGKAVGSVNVAVNRKRGEEEATDFYRVTLWESLAENAAALDKGTRVVVIGRQEQREYETREGEKRQAWEVTASSFGPDLRFASAVVTKTNKGGQSAPAAEPWAAATPGSGGFDGYETGAAPF